MNSTLQNWLKPAHNLRFCLKKEFTEGSIQKDFGYKFMVLRWWKIFGHVSTHTKHQRIKNDQRKLKIKGRLVTQIHISFLLNRMT